MQITQQLRKELTLDKSTLSSTRRRKESAPDPRPSAKATGGLGIIFIVIVLCLIVLPDLIAIVRALHSRGRLRPGGEELGERERERERECMNE